MQCAVTLERFRESGEHQPVVMPGCGHTFSKGAITQLVTRALVKKGGAGARKRVIIKCPCCKKRQPKVGSTDAFPVNWAVIDHLRLVKEPTAHITPQDPPIDLCEDDEPPQPQHAATLKRKRDQDTSQELVSAPKRACWLPSLDFKAVSNCIVSTTQFTRNLVYDTGIVAKRGCTLANSAVELVVVFPLFAGTLLGVATGVSTAVITSDVMRAAIRSLKDSVASKLGYHWMDHEPMLKSVEPCQVMIPRHFDCPFGDCGQTLYLCNSEVQMMKVKGVVRKCCPHCHRRLEGIWRPVLKVTARGTELPSHRFNSWVASWAAADWGAFHPFKTFINMDHMGLQQPA